MEDYISRMKEESLELSKKIKSLEVFVTTYKFSKLPWKERFLMKGQLYAMKVYKDFLEERISYKS